MITPTAGGLYPTLRDLEKRGLIKGEWVPEKRKKVYRITSKGREVFSEAVTRHFKLASSIRGWFFRELSDLNLAEETDMPLLVEPAVRILLLKEDATMEEMLASIALPNAAEIPHRLSRPPMSIPSKKITATPNIPIRIPPTFGIVRGSPRISRARIATVSGIVLNRTEVSPDVMYCSAQYTKA